MKTIKSLRYLEKGDKFSRLTILDIIREFKKPTLVRAECECGDIDYYLASSVTNGTTKSCGCLKLESVKTRFKKHGLRYHPLYQTYLNMKDRCYNKNGKNYSYYGERGILVCDEWKNNFKAFHDWAIANGWKPKLTLERIDNEGDYESGNCKWATRLEQGNNKRNNNCFVAFNETKTLAEWSRDERCKVVYHTLKTRIRKGWDAEKAITTPSRKPVYISINAFGETKTIKDWSRDARCPVPYGTLIARITKYRWEPEKTIVTPLQIEYSHKKHV